MSDLIFENVSVSFPVLAARGMSLRNHLVRVATGGIIERETGRITTVSAIRNANFRIQSGDSVGLIGHNGSGKSTLLRTMAGILTPTQGTISREGKVATVFDIGAGLEPELTGYENIVNLSLMMGRDVKSAKLTIPDIEAFTDLGDFLQLPVRTYSSGMTMRLMFAVATSVSPQILLIDEMFSTGDAKFQQKSLKRIENLISSAQILVIASHNLNYIKNYCNRCFRMEHGNLEEISIEAVT